MSWSVEPRWHLPLANDLRHLFEFLELPFRAFDSPFVANKPASRFNMHCRPSAHLCRKEQLLAHLLDLVPPLLDLVNVPVLVNEYSLEHYSRGVIRHAGGQGDGLVVGLDGPSLRPMVALKLLGHRRTDRQASKLVDDRRSLEEQDAGNQLLGVLHRRKPEAWPREHR